MLAHTAPKCRLQWNTAPGWEEREEREPEGETLWDLSAHENTVTCSSASWTGCSNDVRWWHWTHSAVFLGRRVTNCSSTTRLTMALILRGSTNNHWQSSQKLLGQHKRAVAFSQGKGTEALPMLLSVVTHHLQDGPGDSGPAICVSPYSSGIKRTGYCALCQLQASTLGSSCRLIFMSATCRIKLPFTFLAHPAP